MVTVAATNHALELQALIGNGRAIDQYCSRHGVLVKPYMLPIEGIWGLAVKNDRHVDGIPRVLAVDKQEVQALQNGTKAWRQTPFVYPPAGVPWTFDLFKEWVMLCGCDDANYLGKFESNGTWHTYKERDGSALTYARNEFTYSWENNSKTASDPRSAMFGLSPVHPLQTSSLRPNSYSSFARLAANWALIQTSPVTPTEQIYAQLTSGVTIPEKYLALYSQELILATVAHKRMLTLFGPEGELRGWKG